MEKPKQDELDTTISVLEYILAEIYANEPYARNTIDDLEAVLAAMPRIEDELGDIE